MNKNKPIWLKCTDRSMNPLIIPNDELYIKYIFSRKIKINDIVIYEIDRKSFPLRVIYKSNYIVLKGDNSTKSYRIYNEKYIGKILRIRRNKILYSIQDFYVIQTTLYFKELTKIKKACEKQGIDLVFLKGLIPYFYYFKIIPQRIYADCDILIKKEMFLLVKKILFELEYKEISENKYSRMHKILRATPTEFTFTRKLSSISINLDIHLELIYLMTQNGLLGQLYPQKLLYRLSDAFQNQRQQIRIYNEKFYILSPENLIVYLSLHFFHHNFLGIQKLELLDKVIRTKEKSFNWLAIADKINRYSINNFVYPVFLLTKRIYSASIPNHFLNKIKPNRSITRYITNNILNLNIFNEEKMPNTGITRIRNMYNLSPSCTIKKIFFILNLNTIHFILSIIIGRIKQMIVDETFMV